MISPKTTMPKVEAITAIVPPPPVSTSSRIVIVLFTFKRVEEYITRLYQILTRTLPSSMEQRRKLPMARIGIIAWNTREW